MDKNEVLNHVRDNVTQYQKLSKLVTRFLEWQIYKHNTKVSLLEPKYRAKAVSSIEQNYQFGKYSQIPGEEEYINEPRDIVDLAAGRLIFNYREELDRFVANMKAHASHWFGGQPEIKSKLSRNPQRMIRREVGYDSYHTQLGIYRGSQFWLCLKPEDQEMLAQSDILYCEIQLRSLLQDVFAETAHKFHYKLGPNPSLTTTNKLTAVAAKLEEIDATIDEIRIAAEDFSPREEARTSQWMYDDSGYLADAFSDNSVKYPYELLLDANHEPELELTWELFNIDQEMMKKEGIDNYKEKVWANIEPENKNRVSYDTIAVRALSFDKAKAKIQIQPAKYSDQAVSNHKFALSKEVDGRLVSSLAYYTNGQLLAFGDSPMSNTIGISCVIRTADDQWVVSTRSNNVAFDPGRAGCSASGALEWGEKGTWTVSKSMDWVKEGMLRECEEELGFIPSLGSIQYLGFAREFARAGKPQFFFWIDCMKDEHHYLADRSLTYFWLYGNKEHDQVLFLDRHRAMQAVGSDSSQVNLALQGAIPSDELRMNLALALKAAY